MIINQITKGSGVTPTGTITITSNGITDVTNYANADVQVPTTAPAHYIEKTVNANGVLQNSANIINLNGVTDVGFGVLAWAYYSAPLPTDTELNLPFTNISGISACEYAFYACQGIKTVNLPALTTISGASACAHMFDNCSGITSVSLSALTAITGSNACSQMFRNCLNLTSITFTSLRTITGSSACANMFFLCSALANMYFPAITTSSFGSSKNQFSNMCYGAANITLHFPSNVQSVIEGLTGYSTTAPFGATSGTVLFDLPATE